MTKPRLSMKLLWQKMSEVGFIDAQEITGAKKLLYYVEESMKSPSKSLPPKSSKPQIKI